MEELLSLLGEHRAKKKPYWLAVGQVIHGSMGDKKGQPLWVKFSGKYHDEKECTATHFVPWERNLLTTITLQHYAREDNPAGYRKWLLSSALKLLKPSNLAAANTAAIAGLVLAPDYLYNKKDWRHLKGHRLTRVDESEVLEAIVSKVLPVLRELYNSLTEVERPPSDPPVGCEVDDIKIVSLVVLPEGSPQLLLNKILNNFYQTSFKVNVVKMCRDTLFHAGFASNVNASPYIMAWTNGVTECIQDTVYFRSGMLEDFLTVSTGQAFPLQKPPQIDELQAWLTKVFPTKELLDYFLKLAASTLTRWQGETSRLGEVYRISPSRDVEISKRGDCVWYGDDEHSKQCLAKLFNNMLGDYCLSIYDFNGLIPPRPEHAIIGYMPEEQRVKNVHSTNRFFQIQTHRPTYRTSSPGTLLPFLSEEEFDPFFENRLPELTPAFVWLCAQYFSRYKNEGLAVPKSVVDELRQSDPINLFFKETGISPDSTEGYKQYKEWHKSNFPNESITPLSEFNQRLKETLPLPPETN